MSCWWHLKYWLFSSTDLSKTWTKENYFVGCVTASVTHRSIQDGALVTFLVPNTPYGSCEFLSDIQETTLNQVGGISHKQLRVNWRTSN